MLSNQSSKFDPGPSQNLSRINDVLYYIHQDISRELLAGDLAKVAAYSEQHFHRIFKKVVGEPVHKYIRRTRMEYAANQLMFDLRSPILDIAGRSGFNSVSSFSRAFKSTFLVSPGEWRKGSRQLHDKPYLKNEEVARCYRRIDVSRLPTPEITQVPERHVAYIRHTGYNRSIKQPWQLLKAWADSESRDFSAQFGIHHSNPAWVELDQCRYVACVEIDRPLTQRGVVNQLTIPKGLYAKFSLHGIYGELLPQISLIQEHWLPRSGLKMQSTPAYVNYHKNHFLAEDERFELDFYLPIGFF
ncbi:GyrI-like domain-containing protein [Vibrio tapetis subsp. quintayensis]|uniref:AraC family transcriptional regulator n=1 Tax=Vibrio tapetis TaxID=52443 RepID=UPI0025B5580E|nr:GyrI-like domain-containing protein [Vibrio tapetis]MDN3681884.1 GyrI-like domain-containing protein [Vibrio tapetis subsp. quintayensis]